MVHVRNWKCQGTALCGWNFQTFSATQILREINSRESDTTDAYVEPAGTLNTHVVAARGPDAHAEPAGGPNYHGKLLQSYQF